MEFFQQILTTLTLNFIPGVLESNLLLCMFLLVFVDLVTGLGKAVKTGQPVTSNALGKTVNKILAYFGVYILALVVAYIAANVFMMGSMVLLLVPVVLSFLCLREGWSIVENVEKLGVKLPKKLKRIMHGIMEEIESEEKTDNNSKPMV